MTQGRRIAALPGAGASELGRLLADERKTHAWTIDDVIQRMSLDPTPHPGSLRGIESGSRLPSADLTAAWLTALGWTVTPDPDDADRLEATHPDDATVEILFAARARSHLMLAILRRALDDHTWLAADSLVGTGLATTVLRAADRLHRDPGAPRCVWLVAKRAQVRQLLERARQLDVNIGSGGGVTSLKKAIADPNGSWSTAIGTTIDGGDPHQWRARIEGPLLLLCDQGVSAPQVQQWIGSVDGGVLLSSTPGEPPTHKWWSRESVLATFVGDAPGPQNRESNRALFAGPASGPQDHESTSTGGGHPPVDLDFADLTVEERDGILAFLPELLTGAQSTRLAHYLTRLRQLRPTDHDSPT